MEIEIKIESKDLYDYLLHHAYSSPSGLLGSCFGAVLIILAAGTGQWFYLLFGVVILLYLPWTLFLRSKQQLRTNESFKKPLHYLLDDNGMTISQGEESLTVPWEEMHKAVSTGKSILLYTSPVNAVIFPKMQLGDQRMALVEMISTHMPPAKVKIRT